MTLHNPYDSYRGATCLVTGGGSGLGLAIAEALAAVGARTWIADRDPERITAVADRVPGIVAIETDVTDREQVDALFGRLAAEAPALDVAFLNAGVNAGAGMAAPGGALEDFPADAWDRVMAVNLTGFFWTLQGSAALMKPQGAGAIVVTGSTSGLRAEPMIGYAYIAAKHAVHGLTKQAALELSAYGIRVNAVAPGPINTAIGGAGPRPEEKTHAWERTVPLGRWGEPHEVAAHALLLGSSAASFTTGAIHVIDGGATTLSQVQSPALRPED